MSGWKALRRVLSWVSLVLLDRKCRSRVSPGGVAGGA